MHFGPFPLELGPKESASPNSAWLTTPLGPFAGPATMGPEPIFKRGGD